MSFPRLLTRTALATTIVSVMAGAAFAQVPPAAAPAAVPAPAATDTAQPPQGAVKAGQATLDPKAPDAAAAHAPKGHPQPEPMAKDAKALPDTAKKEGPQEAQKGGKSAEHRMDDVKKQHGKEAAKGTAPQPKPAQ